MLRLNTRTLNLLAKIKEKIQGAVPLSPADMVLQGWLRRMKHREARRAYYRTRNAAYPYQGKREIARRNRQRNRVELRAKLAAFDAVLCLRADQFPANATRATIEAKRAELHAAYVANAPHKWQREQVAA